MESTDCDQVEEKRTRKRKGVGEVEGGKACPPPKKAKRMKKKEKPLQMVLTAGGDEEAEFRKARAATYHECVSGEKTENRETNPVLHDVINAGARGFGYLRKPFNVYFENDKPWGLSALSCNYFLLTVHRWSLMR